MKKTPTSRTEAINIALKRQKSIIEGTEETLQASIFRSYRDKFPDRKYNLFATFSNPTVEQIGVWRTKGFTEGISDIIHIDDNKHIVGIEVKHELKVHSAVTVLRQCEFLSSCHRGYFCTSVEMFWTIINGGDGICPTTVKSFLENKSTIRFKDLYL